MRFLFFFDAIATSMRVLYVFSGCSVVAVRQLEAIPSTFSWLQSMVGLVAVISGEIHVIKFMEFVCKLN